MAPGAALPGAKLAMVPLEGVDERSWRQRRLAPGGRQLEGRPVPEPVGRTRLQGHCVSPEACARGLSPPTPGPLPLPLGPAAHVKTPRGRLLHGVQGTGAGPLGASGLGALAPALAGDGGTFHPPPLTRGVWPQPGAPPGAEARGSGQQGRAHSGQSSMGRRLGMGRAEGHSGWEVHSAGWPWETGAVGTALSRQVPGFPLGGGSSGLRPRLQNALRPPVSAAPLGLGPFCAPGGAVGPPEVRVHACPL